MKYFQKYILIGLISFVIIAIPVNSIHAQKIGTGLEVEKPEIYVYVKSNINNNININDALIKSKVESRLRNNDIKVLKNSSGNDYYLYITLKTFGSNNNVLYNIGVKMVRVTFYALNDVIYSKQTTTWSEGSFGRGNSDSILKIIENYTDIFITEFYKSNNF